MYLLLFLFSMNPYLSFPAFASMGNTMNIAHLAPDLRPPRVNISWSAQGGNATYKLELVKVQGTPHKLNKVTHIKSTKQDFILFDVGKWISFRQ